MKKLRIICSLALWLAIASLARASVLVETGTFTANTGGTATTVSTGFQGKAAIFFTYSKTAEGESAGAAFSVGFSDGTNRRTVAWAGDDSVSTTNVGHYTSSAAGAVLTNGTPTLGTGGTISGVAFNATPNMVVTFDATPASAWKWSYILFGGDDITNVKVGSFTASTSTGNQSTTGLGFQPDAIFFITGKQTSTGTATSFYETTGFATKPSGVEQWVISSRGVDAQSANYYVKSVVRSDACLTAMTATGNSADFVADFTQFTSDGFDLNYSTAASSAWNIYYLAVKGGHWDAGAPTKPATAATQSVTGLAYAPKLLGLFMSSATALNTYTSNAVNTVGAGTSSSSRFYVGSYHNNVFNTVAYSGGSSSLISHEMQATANADLTTLGSDGSWTITWSAAGTAYYTPWFTVGDTAAGGGAGGVTLTGGVTLSGSVTVQ
jgi:hypothetical protein